MSTKMNSTSIARQNRRMRLKQNLTNFNSHLSLKKLSSLERNSSDKITNESDKVTNTDDDKIDTDSTSIKLDHTDRHPGYEIFSYAANNDYLMEDMSSKPVEKIFVEGNRGFREINAPQIFHISLPEISLQSENENEVDLALKTARYFHHFSNFCHGLLGGLSLLHILVLLHLFSDLLVDADTVKYYSFFSKPIHNLFNFLCIICCVSVLDRFEITNMMELLKMIKKFDYKLITLIVYPICLLLSLSSINVDDKLSMPHQNATLWESLNFKEESELYYWKTLSISKCFGALLGWMVISWDQSFNLFLSCLGNILQRRKMPLN